MTWVLNNLELIGSRTLSHLLLAVPAIVASFVLALPLGWVANRYRWSRATLLTAAGLLYAIPSLPLFVVLPSVLGFGVRDRINEVRGEIRQARRAAREARDALDQAEWDLRRVRLDLIGRYPI